MPAAIVKYHKHETTLPGSCAPWAAMGLRLVATDCLRVRNPSERLPGGPLCLDLGSFQCALSQFAWLPSDLA